LHCPGVVYEIHLRISLINPIKPVLRVIYWQINEDITVPRRDSSLTAWVNVIYGCNEKCTYCVVPFTRGQEQSRQPADIRREMLALGEAGQDEGRPPRQHVLADVVHSKHLQLAYPDRVASPFCGSPVNLSSELDARAFR